MAFNPFNVFRRNQKTLFAILTVVVMFMFVLSFGRGDFFDWLPRWLGAKGGPRGELLATVDGSKVYEKDLNRIQTKRTLANQYMSEAAARAADNLGRYISEGLSRVSAENRKFIEQVLVLRRSAYVNPQTIQFVQMGFVPPERLAQEQEQTIAFLQTRLGEIASKSAQEQDKDVARVAQSLIELDLRQASATGRRGQYFSNLPHTGQNKELMEFKLWLTKADKLGVEFVERDVADLVNEEFFRRLTNEDMKAIEDGLRGKHGYSPDLLKEALADEFKVRLAQTAVLGEAVLRPYAGVYDDPYDYFRFYKEQTSAARFGMITVPAENYVSRVQGQPTQTELQDIFRKSKNVEPNPALPSPGLKEPRKLKLAWLEATGNEPYYKQAAAEGVKLAGVMSRANGFLSLASSLGGVTTASLLGAPAPLAMQDPVLDAKYAEYRNRQRDIVRDSWYSNPVFVVRPQVPDHGFLRPENAAAVAGAAGPAGEAFEADRKARLQALPAALIAPVSPTFGVAKVMIAAAAAQAKFTQPLPLDAVRAQLAERAADDMARQVCEGDLEKFRKEMEKFNVQRVGSEAAGQAEAYAEKFAKERGLKTGRSEAFRDQFHIADDPGLKPIKDKAEASRPFHGGGYINPADLGVRFFYEQNPLTRQAEPATGLFKPQPYPSPFLAGPTKDESALLVWRTADQPAEAPRDANSPEVKAKLEAAWRMQKARELAKKDAEELAQKSQGLGTSFLQIEQKLRDIRAEFAGKFGDPAEKDRVTYFPVDDVAPVVSQNLPTGGMPRQSVGAFTLTPTVNIPYPSPKMEDELVKAKDRPPSSTLVLADNPEDRYYVAVVLSRSDKSADEFAAQVYGPSSVFSDVAPVIVRRHQDELRKQARDRALAMLKAEMKYEEKSDKVNKQSDTTEE
jgi:hypothetical protein